MEVKIGAKGGLALLTAAHLMSDVYFSFIITLLPLFVSLFGLPFSAVGLLIFLQNAGFAALVPIAGYFADRTARPTFGIGMLIVALTMSAVGFAPSYSALIVLVLIATIGQALFAAQAASTAAHSSGSLRGLGLSIYLTGGTLGGSLGPMAIAALVTTAGLQRAWLMMLPGLLLAAMLSRAFAARGEAPGGIRRPGAIRSSLDMGPVLALVCVLVLRGAAETGIISFLPLLIEQKGGGLIAVGTTVGLFKLSCAAGTLIGGLLSERKGWKPMMVLSLVLAVPLCCGLLRADGFLALVFVALLGAALRASFPYAFLIAQRLLPEHSSTAAGLVLSLSLLGGGLGALGEGFLADGVGVEMALLIVGVTLPLGAAVAAVGLRE